MIRPSIAPLLLLTAACFAGCGGGGGGNAAPQRVTVAGKLLLEQEPVAAVLEESARHVSEAEARREPNDNIFSATDLGAELPLRLEDRVGGVDARDVLRFGPVGIGGARLRVRIGGGRDLRAACFVGGGLELAARAFDASPGLESRASSDASSDASSESASDTAPGEASGRDLTIDLGSGEELCLLVEAGGSETLAYRLRIEEQVSASQSGGGSMLSSIAAADAWRRTLGVAADEALPGEVIVGLHADASLAESSLSARAALSKLGLELSGGSGDLLRFVSKDPTLHAGGDVGLAGLANLLREARRTLPDARYVSPNLMSPLSRIAGLPQSTVPNDPGYKPNQWNLRLARFPAAWSTTTGSKDVAVAILDTGIRKDHPDVGPRVSTLGYDFISDPKNALDGDGVDADPEEPIPIAQASLTHGTRVAGMCCAATNNHIGIAGGVWQGDVMMLRAIGWLGTSTFDRIQALRYATGQTNASGRVLSATQRPRVLCMTYALLSITAAESSEIVEAARRGLLMVAAAGNDGRSTAVPWPASHADVIGVGAVDQSSKHAPYSNTGSFVEVSAPGGLGDFSPFGVPTTFGFVDNGKLVFSYSGFEGTSLATPTVGAAVALMESVHRNLDLRILRQVLAQTSQDLGTKGFDAVYGHGLIDVGAAVTRAKTLSSPPVAEVSPAGYRFSRADTATILNIRNVGQRILERFSIHAVGQVSGALSFRFEEATAPTRLFVDLDRSKALVGLHQERYELRSTANATPLDFMFRRPIPAQDGPLVVRLLSGTNTVSVTAAASDGSFHFSEVLVGSYVLEAGVDRDRNGELGDAQEWYLRMPIVVGADRVPGLSAVKVPWKN